MHGRRQVGVEAQVVAEVLQELRLAGRLVKRTTGNRVGEQALVGLAGDLCCGLLRLLASHAKDIAQIREGFNLRMEARGGEGGEGAEEGELQVAYQQANAKDIAQVGSGFNLSKE